MTFTDRSDEQAMQVRRAVLGDDHVDRAVARTGDLDRDFQALATQFAWGGLWSRDALDRPTRSLVTVAILAALGREAELRMHLEAALRRTGAPREQVIEALLHVAIYAGLPAANEGFRLLTEVAAAVDDESASASETDPVQPAAGTRPGTSPAPEEDQA